MANAGGFTQGQLVVVRGRMIGRITEISTDEIAISELDLAPGETGGVAIAAANADGVLRPLATAGEAEAILASLRAPAAAVLPAAVDERSIAYRRIVKRGDLAEQADTLVAIYRNPDPDYPERQYTDILEGALTAELSLALDRPRKAMKAIVRAAARQQPEPVTLDPVPAQLAALAAAGAPPELGELVPLGAIVIDTKMAIGEAQAELTLRAKRGVWFAYQRGDMDNEPFELVAIHHAELASLQRHARAAVAVGSVHAEGATIAIFDAAELADDEFVDAVLGGDPVGHRCVVVGLGGDVESLVRATDRHGFIVYVRVVLSDEVAA